MVLVHGNIIPTKHVGERTDSLRSKNWILILKKIDLRRWISPFDSIYGCLGCAG